jgi:hypothetical protein
VTGASASTDRYPVAAMTAILLDVPIVAVVVGVGLSALGDDHDVARAAGRRPFDGIGLGLLAAGLIALLLALSEAARWPVPVTVSVGLGGWH